MPPVMETPANWSPGTKTSDWDTEHRLSGGEGACASAWGLEVPTRYSWAHLIKQLTSKEGVIGRKGFPGLNLSSVTCSMDYVQWHKVAMGFIAGIQSA